MNELQNQVVVVGGGTGSVGEGLVRTFLQENATVIVPYRSEEKRLRLEQYASSISGGALICLEGNIGDEASIQVFRNELRKHTDHIDLAVACIGGWYYGYSLHRMPFSDWQRVLHNNLTTHFLFMRAILSIMHDRNHGTYVMINGGASELIAPESGMISIVAAAQKMMTRVLVQEAHGTSVRVYAIVVHDPVKTRDRKREVVDGWLAPDDIAHYVTSLHLQRLPNAAQPIHTLYTRDDVADMTA
jgi:NADP-dependent 3-hydroxy acid dehydrogenase YdfG